MTELQLKRKINELKDYIHSMEVVHSKRIRAWEEHVKYLESILDDTKTPYNTNPLATPKTLTKVSI